MSEEENILQMIIQKESWEEVLYQIVSLENLDPWDVDLVKLVDSFLKYIGKMEELDFRIPAKIVFVAAVLLRLKAEYLSIFEEESLEPPKEEALVDLGIDPDLIQLGVPMKRMPKRQVTLNELVSALHKALVVRERRTERHTRWNTGLRLEVVEEEDISKRIDDLMSEIDGLMKQLKENKLAFRSVVGEWSREKVIEHFVPLLHLEQSQKIDCEQEDYFKEIYITRRDFPEDEK